MEIEKTEIEKMEIEKMGREKTYPQVRGIDLDDQTRCAHYRTPMDVIAIQMKCCGLYYACKDCHLELEHHPIEVWPRSQWEQKAVLCGECRTELTIEEYMCCGNCCPSCGAQFNPACRNHHHFYFESAEAAVS